MADYLARQLTLHQDSDGAPAWEAIDNFYNRKLWHQLSIAVTDLLQNPEFPQGGLIELHDNFVLTFVDKINPMTYAKMCLRIAHDCESLEAADAFLKNCKDQVAQSDLATIVLLSSIAEIQLKQSNFDEAKAQLKETEKMLNKVPGVTDSHEYFFRVSAEYYKSQGVFHEFYSNALRYLGCVDSCTLPVELQVEWANDLSLAAILGKGVYNFGDLISHPILESIRGTEKEWLIDLLNAFNSGDLSKFEFLRPQWTADSDLSANVGVLEEKVRLLALMEMAFKAPANDRRMPFDVIAEALSVPIDQVELIVMKALSLSLIKGSIDQVESIVVIDWVRPRVLNTEQVAEMGSRFTRWMDSVAGIAASMEEQTPELFASKH